MPATSKEYRNLERARERSKHILAYVNQAVRECENYHKLKDMQKRLDTRAIDASTDPSLSSIKVSRLSLLWLSALGQGRSSPRFPGSF